MERNPPKASSVTADGSPDGWLPPRAWRAQVAPDGSTRLVISVPAEELPEMHLRILKSMKAPLSVAYMQLTDRASGVTHPAPLRFVGLEVPVERVIAALEAAGELVWYDGRHQLWVRGNFGEQVVLDELGMIYCYPDDPHFRDVLDDLPESKNTGMDGRDYVRVSFRAGADAQEKTLIESLNLVKWGGR